MNTYILKIFKERLLKQRVNLGKAPGIQIPLSAQERAVMTEVFVVFLSPLK
jgi:hypothetical protein